MDGVYDSDPKTHPDAKRYVRPTYREALEQRVKVLDTAAVVLAEEQGLVVHVLRCRDGRCHGGDLRRARYRHPRHR
ncbi:hypothetical protein ACH4M4_36395 [Streptomyces sp. NPDC017254]|uniref:amino acid kinase family protein n=1 Tax=unclassified Streptomyces TaxID=2593676 RepID=UPI00378B9974